MLYKFNMGPGTGPALDLSPGQAGQFFLFIPFLLISAFGAARPSADFPAAPEQSVTIYPNSLNSFSCETQRNGGISLSLSVVLNVRRRVRRLVPTI